MLHRIAGIAQHYDWGDDKSIPALFGLRPDARPWAEMWFGTHHLAPARLDSADGAALSDLAGEMEMLVKILAAARPLSLQTHPTRQQAEDGHAREEARGIPLTAPERMYKDRSDKPEILIALTTFEALCGFRTIDDSLELFDSMNWDEERAVLGTEGIEGYLRWSFTRSLPPTLDDCPQWLIEVANLYPHDPALRVAPLLNHVTLRPGQALSLPAGNLHAYLHGCGLEVMNSSDNVVRAGFTSKHVDVAELISILDTTALTRPVSEPNAAGDYPSPSDAFSVARLVTSGPVEFAATDRHRIVFGPFDTIDSTTKPSMWFLAAGDTATLPAESGRSVWICTQR